MTLLGLVVALLLVCYVMGDEATPEKEIMADQIKKYKYMTNKVTKDMENEIGKRDAGDSLEFSNNYTKLAILSLLYL